MSIPLHSTTVCCFGEILWDVLPDGAQPGGAPLNVTYHLAKLGVPAILISRVGNDPEGKGLEELMDQWNLQRGLIQIDQAHDTSRVLARINSDNEVSYEIVYPVAWDFIEATLPATAVAKTVDYFVYGSLAARNEVSREALLQLLDQAIYKVFDINMRPPFYKKEGLELLLSQADVLKVNKSELEIITTMFYDGIELEDEQVNMLKEEFDISEVVVTKGAAGASYYTQDAVYHATGPAVKVCDTIGSGDSFLAAFIAFHSRQETPDVILAKATAMGAFIAGKRGGCPSYRLSEYMDFYNSVQSDRNE